MKKGGGASGAVSLVMIFCILCLVIFSVLTHTAAERESVLSERNRQSAEEYYRADCEATKIVAALRRGAEPDIEIEWDGETAAFLLPIGESLGLDVAVSLRGGGCEILRWQTVYTGDWEPDEYLNLWDGF